MALGTDLHNGYLNALQEDLQCDGGSPAFILEVLKILIDFIIINPYAP